MILMEILNNRSLIALTASVNILVSKAKHKNKILSKAACLMNKPIDSKSVKTFPPLDNIGDKYNYGLWWWGFLVTKCKSALMIFYISMAGEPNK